MKLAVTLRAAVMLTEQVLAVPVQDPDHPPKVEPDAAVAVKVTLVPDAKEALQVAPQAMPAGDEFTVPDAVP